SSLTYEWSHVTPSSAFRSTTTRAASTPASSDRRYSPSTNVRSITYLGIDPPGVGGRGPSPGPSRNGSTLVERWDQRVRAGVDPGRVRIPGPGVHGDQVGVPEVERCPALRARLRAGVLRGLRRERAVLVVARRAEAAVLRSRERRRLRLRRKHPLEGAELPGG